MLVSPTGPTLPLNHVFGLGNANGIENDVSLKGFTIVSQSGVETDAASASLIQGTFVTVNAYLGFEGVRDAVPRTGQAQVRLLVDGQDKGSTSLHPQWCCLDYLQRSFECKQPRNGDRSYACRWPRCRL